MIYSNRKLIIICVLALVGAACVLSANLTKRQTKPSDAATGAGADLFGKILGTYLDTLVKPETNGTFWDGNRECGHEGGCYKGYCWSSCDATAFNNEWCYTTKGYSQDFKYVECGSDSDCSLCWKCAGSCTA